MGPNSGVLILLLVGSGEALLIKECSIRNNQYKEEISFSHSSHLNHLVDLHMAPVDLRKAPLEGNLQAQYLDLHLLYLKACSHNLHLVYNLSPQASNLKAKDSRGLVTLHQD